MSLQKILWFYFWYYFLLTSEKDLKISRMVSSFNQRKNYLSINHVQLLHSHLHVHAGYILTQWITDERRFFITKYLPLFIVRVRKGLCVRGSWRPNRTEILWPPTLMAVNVVSFSFSWCSTRGPGVHSAGCWLSLLHLISIFSGFPYHISSITPSPALLQLNGNRNSTALTSVSTELYNSSTATRSLKSNV